jgi:hypothetical protein
MYSFKEVEAILNKAAGPEMVQEELQINEEIEKQLDKQFPKGDPARNRAFILAAVAHMEIEKAKTAKREKFISQK